MGCCNYKELWEMKDYYVLEKMRYYSFEKKLSVVELYLSSEISYQDLALQEGITNSSHDCRTGLIAFEQLVLMR